MTVTVHGTITLAVTDSVNGRTLHASAGSLRDALLRTLAPEVAYRVLEGYLVHGAPYMARYAGICITRLPEGNMIGRDTPYIRTAADETTEAATELRTLVPPQISITIEHSGDGATGLIGPRIRIAGVGADGRHREGLLYLPEPDGFHFETTDLGARTQRAAWTRGQDADDDHAYFQSVLDYWGLTLLS